MKRLSVVTGAFLLLLLNNYSFAQTTDAQAFTLEQSIQYALENSFTIKNSVLDERVATAQVRETIGIGLPQITGNASINHNQKLQRFFTTYNPNGGFINIDPVPPGLNPGDVISAQNFFQLKSSGTASVTINQIIFSGSYLVGLQASNTFKELSQKTTDQSRQQVVEMVTKAYYSVLVNQERMKLFDSNISRVDSLLKTTKQLHQNGFAESIDVDRIEVSLNNLITERSKFERLQQLSLELLKFQMNYPMSDPIAVVGELNEELASVDLNELLKDWNYKNRPDYQILETNRRLQNLNIKNNYAGSLPSISAFANLGYSSQSPNVGGLFKTDTQIDDDGLLGPDKWYSFSSFGVSMNIPLFSGLQRTYKIQQEKLKLQKIENGFKSLESGIDLEVRQTTLIYQNSIEALKSQRRNIDLASNVARVTKIKYEQGIGSNIEVVDAEASLKESQINFYNSLFDALIAKTDLEKAFGKLLPVTESK